MSYLIKERFTGMLRRRKNRQKEAGKEERKILLWKKIRDDSEAGKRE